MNIPSLFDIEVNYLDGHVRLIRLVPLHVLDRMHRLQPRQKASKDGVLLVEPRHGVGGDEEFGIRSCSDLRWSPYGLWEQKEGLSDRFQVKSQRGTGTEPPPLAASAAASKHPSHTDHASNRPKTRL